MQGGLLDERREERGDEGKKKGLGCECVCSTVDTDDKYEDSHASQTCTNKEIKKHCIFSSYSSQKQ